MKITLARIAEFQRHYPDAAPLVEKARIAVADAFGSIMHLRTEMHHADDEVGAKMEAAHMARR